MTFLGSTLIARASLGAVIAAAALAVAPAPAAAQTTTIAGGGASFPSIALRQLFDCYGVPPGGTAASPRPRGCGTRINNTATFLYNSVGSGAGQRGWASQDPQRIGGSPLLPDVNFAASEAALTSTQLSAFLNGGTFSSGQVNIADQSDNCVAPASGNGTDPRPANLATGCYDNPRVENGPAIQIPFVGGGIVLAFDPVYKRVRNADGTVTDYRYQFTQRADGSGGLRLSRTAFCNIFSGNTTRWNANAITAANGGTPVWPDPADPDTSASVGRAIQVVVRDDDSGTTALFTRALRAQCPGQFTAALPSGFAQTFPGNPSPNSLPANSTTCELPPGARNTALSGLNVVYARGNEGVARCINTRNPRQTAGAVVGNGRIGYVNAGFALPFANTAPYTGYALMTVDLQNASGNYAVPTEAAFTEALAAAAPPAPANRNNPLAWVSDPSGAVSPNPVADPPGATAWPLVGTSNFLLYTCYDSAAKADAVADTTPVQGFLNWYYGNGSSIRNILSNNGFVPLPATIRTAVTETFLNAADPLGLNLYIRSTPSGLCTTGS